MGEPRGDNGQTVFVVMNPFSYRKSYTGPVFSTLDRSVSSIIVKAKRLPSGQAILDVPFNIFRMVSPAPPQNECVAMVFFPGETPMSCFWMLPTEPKAERVPPI